MTIEANTESTPSTPSTPNDPGTSPSLLNPGKQDANVDPKQQTAPKPDALGSQFAALTRKGKALDARERDLRSKEEQLTASLRQAQELETLSADELLERIASKRGGSVDEIIKGYIAKKTGAPNDDQILKESKDPAVAALARKLEESERSRKELETKLKSRDEEDQRQLTEAQQRAVVQQVQSECLNASTDAWKDADEKSDFALFFADHKELSQSVFAFCGRRVAEFQQTYGTPPDEDDIKAFIKAAPGLMLKELLETPKGKRLVALRTQVATSQPKLSQPKPRLSPNIRRLDDDDSDPTNNKVRTRFDNEYHVARAKRLIPDGVQFELSGL